MVVSESQQGTPQTYRGTIHTDHHRRIFASSNGQFTCLVGPDPIQGLIAIPCQSFYSDNAGLQIHRIVGCNRTIVRLSILG